MNLRNLNVEEFIVNNQDFKKLILRVLQSISSQYEENFPSFSIHKGFSRWGAHVLDNNLTFDIDQIEKESDGSIEIKIGIIAHELAHVYLDHGISQENPIMSSTQEDEADLLASQWGFSQEIKAMRKTI